jgi:hypothetical protein
MSDTEPKVYAAIAAVAGEIGKEGIAKGRKNQQQGYAFRGIDEIYNALSPVISKHKLCILPRILSRALTERQTQKGGVLFSVVVEAEFDFISAEDGSRHVVRTFGEAMDSADKATNKAMSAAYKYAAMQAFCIPTEGDADADADSHEVAPKRAARAPANETPFDDERPQPTARTAYLVIASEAIRFAKTEAALREWWSAEKDNRRKNGLNQEDIDVLRAKMTERVDALAEIARTANGHTPSLAEELNDEIPF